MILFSLVFRTAEPELSSFEPGADFMILPDMPSISFVLIYKIFPKKEKKRRLLEFKVLNAGPTFWINWIRLSKQVDLIQSYVLDGHMIAADLSFVVIQTEKGTL